MKQSYTLNRVLANEQVKALRCTPAERLESIKNYGGYHTASLRLVPIAEIDVPPVWNPHRVGPLREAMAEDKPLPPIRLSPDGKRYGIGDGIHRTNVSIEKGYTHVPAIVVTWVKKKVSRK